MTNYEKFKDVIDENVCFAVENGVPDKCQNVTCANCDFDVHKFCNPQRFQWCTQEYKEPEKPEKPIEKVKDNIESSGSFVPFLAALLIYAAELEALKKMGSDDALDD